MLQRLQIRLSKTVLLIGLAIFAMNSPLRAEEEWRGVSDQLLEAVRAQDMAALLSIFKSPQYYQDDEEVMADLKDYFWEAEWFKKKFPDGKSIYEIAMSEDIVHFGTLQPDGTFIVVYIPKSQVSAMGSPGFLENQWMREYFACRFGQVEGVWKLVGTPCFYQAGGPYQEPYG